MQNLMREMENWRYGMMKEAAPFQIGEGPTGGVAGRPITNPEQYRYKAWGLSYPNQRPTAPLQLPLTGSDIIQANLPANTPVVEPPMPVPAPPLPKDAYPLNNPEDFRGLDPNGQYYIQSIPDGMGNFDRVIWDAQTHQPVQRTRGFDLWRKQQKAIRQNNADAEKFRAEEAARQKAEDLKKQEEAKAKANAATAQPANVNIPAFLQSPFMRKPVASPYKPLTQEEADAITKDWQAFQAAGGDPGSVPYPSNTTDSASTPFYKNPNTWAGAGVGGLLGGGLGYLLGDKKNKALSTLLGVGGGALLGGLGSNYFMGKPSTSMVTPTKTASYNPYILMQKQALGAGATSAIGAGIGGLAGYLLGNKDDKLFSTLTGAGIGALGGYGVGKYMNPSVPATTTTTTPPAAPAPVATETAKATVDTAPSLDPVMTARVKAKWDPEVQTAVDAANGAKDLATLRTQLQGIQDKYKTMTADEQKAFAKTMAPVMTAMNNRALALHPDYGKKEGFYASFEPHNLDRFLQRNETVGPYGTTAVSYSVRNPGYGAASIQEAKKEFEALAEAERYGFVPKGSTAAAVKRYTSALQSAPGYTYMSRTGSNIPQLTGLDQSGNPTYWIPPSGGKYSKGAVLTYNPRGGGDNVWAPERWTDNRSRWFGTYNADMDYMPTSLEQYNEMYVKPLGEKARLGTSWAPVLEAIQGIPSTL